MDGINIAQILGNLGADPELRMLEGGNAVLKMRIATNEPYWDKEKVKHDRTEWHRVTIFGRRAEGLAKFLRKGYGVFVKGRNHTSSYDKDGQKHYSTEIIADDIIVVSKPQGLTDGASLRTSATTEAPFAPSSSNGAYGRPPAMPAATDIPF